MQYLSNYLSHDFPDSVQNDPNYQIFSVPLLSDTLYVADDSEWVSPITDVNHIRQQADIISHQYVLKYGNYPAKEYIIFRKPSDKPFGFWDMVAVIRQYLNDVGYKAHYTDKELKQFNSLLNPSKKIKANWERQLRIPPIVMATYFGGVDVTAYSDWYKYLDGKNINKNKSTAMIALYKDVFFTSQLTLAVSSSDRKRKVPIRITYRDTMALAPQGGLAKLGEIVNQPKLDTAKWDKEDHDKGIISNADYYKFKSRGGYYKTHMRQLLINRPKDYFRYAMGDSEITLKYLGFFLNQEKKVYDDGLIDSLHIPATLTSLSDEIADHYAKQPYYENQAKDLLDQLFDGDDVDLYLRPAKYVQEPPKYKKEWQYVLTATNLKDAKDDQDLADRIALQHRLIDKLKSFMARDAVSWAIMADGRLCQYLPHSLENLIDFNKLYELNPNFNPVDLLDDEKNIKVKQYRPHFGNLDGQLNNNYTKVGYHLRRNTKNELPSLSDLLTYLWEKSLYSNYHEIKDHTESLVDVSPVYWLDKKIDYRYSRHGYYFMEPDGNKAKHEAKAHDLISVRPDPTYNQGFKMALQSYVGGMNLCYCPGVLLFKYTYDVDLKSSYVNAGHLIPDFRLDVEPIVDATNLTINEFNKKVRPKMLNDVFTLGVCDVDYKLPDNIRRVPVGVKQAKKGATPRYVLEHHRACLTLTDVMDLLDHGADVYFHRIIIPVQKRLDGSFDTLASTGKMQDWTLSQRNQAKKEYGKSSPEQEFFKLLGNGAYGKTGQGLSEKTSRNFADGKSYFVPFSRSTNPYLAAQYTSIARYQVNWLMDAMNRLVPGSVISSVTTDGFIFCADKKVDPDKLVAEIRAHAPKQWVQVNDKWFNGQFFEFKSKVPGDTSICSVNTPLVNIRTRFNFTLDGRILALTGVLGLGYQYIYQELSYGMTTIDVKSHQLASLVDLKHRTDYKHLLHEWTQPVTLGLGYDDTYKLTKFHDNGNGFGWYESKPFRTVDEVETYKEEAKPFRKLFPLFRSEYAKAWLGFNNNVITTGNTKHIAWVADDVQTSLKAINFDELKDKYHQKYVPQVFLRYLHQHQSELSSEDFKNLYDETESDRYSTFSAFKQAVKRATGFVNELVVIEQNWDAGMNL